MRENASSTLSDMKLNENDSPKVSNAQLNNRTARMNERTNNATRNDVNNTKLFLNEISIE